MPNVARDKNTWNARFEEKGFTIERPRAWSLAILEEMLAGNNITLGILFNDTCKPLSVGVCPSINKECTRLEPLFGLCFRMPHYNGFATLGSLDRDN